MHTFSSHLLCVRWLLTRCPAARAERRDSSPASTVPHTILASWVAFSPGLLWWAPCTPSICGGKRLRNLYKKADLYTVTHCARHIFINTRPCQLGWNRDRAPPTLRQVACGGRTVPPPMVPISTEGMVQDM